MESAAACPDDRVVAGRREDGDRLVDRLAGVFVPGDPLLGRGGGAEIPSAMTLSTSNVFTLRMVETSAGSSQFEWRLAKRSMTDLSLVASATSAALSGDATKGGLAKVGATIYVTAMDGAGGWGSDTRWRVEKRSAIDLTLDAAFGTGGGVLSDPSAGEDVSRQVGVAGGVVYVVGFDEVAGPQQWRIEARFE